MKLGSTYDANKVTAKDWKIFAEDLDISFSLLDDIRLEILAGMKAKIDIAIHELFEDNIPETIQRMRKDIQILR